MTTALGSSWKSHFGEKEIQPDRVVLGVSFDSMEVRLEDFLDGQLPFLRDVDQLAEFLDEEVQSIGDEFLIGQGWPRRKLLQEVVHCDPDFL
jgi:hypothetical protein